MHVGVIGGGLAGTLLAWRLAAEQEVDRITLVSGPATADATAVSGGMVRSYESAPAKRRLAVESMRELHSDATLRDWADFRPLSCVVIAQHDPDIDDVPAAGLDVEVLSAGRLAAAGFANLPETAVGVLDRGAGVIDPARLRAAVRAELVSHPRVTMTNQLTGAADVTVLAAGAWTPQLLAERGLTIEGYRTKAIRYAVFATGRWRPSAFQDDVGGLYGAPVEGGVRLGLASTDWDVPAGSSPFPDGEVTAIRDAAAHRLPQLQLGSAEQTVCSADCYTTTPVLRLREVAGHPSLFTFTGGSGSAAKSALAASRRAAADLLRTLFATGRSLLA